MALRFLDANIIIRHVTKDNQTLSKKAQQILQQIQDGTITVTTCESIISECVHVLASKQLYHFTRQQIKTVLHVILSFRGLQLPHKKTYQRALEIYTASKLDFPDALAVAHMQRQKLTEIYSFDTDFDQISNIKRLDK